MKFTEEDRTVFANMVIVAFVFLAVMAVILAAAYFGVLL